MHPSENQSTLLTRLARRLGEDRTYMAHAVAMFKEQEGFDDDDLASYLNVFPEQVLRLTLCKRPESEALDFAEQVRMLSDFTLIDEALLAHIIRQVDSLAGLAHSPTVTEPEPDMANAFNPMEGRLAAARDRDEIPRDSPGTDSVGKED